MEFRLSMTTFSPSVKSKVLAFHEPSGVAEALAGVADQDAVIVVEALEGCADWGNFYLFLNKDGLAYVKLHEHREFILVDAARESVTGTAMFRDEDGSAFSVAASCATLAARGRSALAYWLPSQEQSPEFTWR